MRAYLKSVDYQAISCKLSLDTLMNRSHIISSHQSLADALLVGDDN
ncbi:hypothetical protein MHPYR_280021 [uncultured Mycobacterium sp.]|uniref:Uncharacterized protein n=1 Tax=uncultured Mycobacterium sp. TaxID=171292 RepID=A0A1Y5PAZ5_9MYCO|nr:hypothetical protein MHPYR_280021 [uncultured Mycobacterium sp.]